MGGVCIIIKGAGGRLLYCLSNKGVAEGERALLARTKNRRKSNRASEGFVFINAVIARARALRPRGGGGGRRRRKRPIIVCPFPFPFLLPAPLVFPPRSKMHSPEMKVELRVSIVSSPRTQTPSLRWQRESEARLAESKSYKRRRGAGLRS